jgi:probable HAF family extracellular repeat protein
MRRLCSFALSLFSFCLLSLWAGAQAYTITDLGPLSPTAINSFDQVVGNYNGQAYLWSFGRMHPLGTLSGGTYSFAAGINDLGVVTGTADGPGEIAPFFGGPTIQCSDLTQPFIWIPRQQMRGLGTAGPASDDASLEDNGCPYPFYGAAINDRGEVVGYSGQLTDVYQWAFLWTNAGGMSLFGTSFWNTFANGISNSGQIVGESGLGEDGGYATSWKNGVATDLGGLPGIPEIGGSGANGVNDLGEIVGFSFTPLEVSPDGSEQGYIHAVMWTRSGTISDLGTLSGDTYSSASRVNLFGLVIGSSGNSVTNSSTRQGQRPAFDVGQLEIVGRPFIWSKATGMLDLNTLIPKNSGWVLNSATDINLLGQIVGEATRDGESHGYLLTPRFPF